MSKITKRLVDKLSPKDSKYFIWDEGDGSIKGFGVAIYPSGQKSYVFQYRNQYGRTKRITIGKHGSNLTPDEARKKANALSVDVFSGNDPVKEKKRLRDALSVNDLLDDYLKSEKFAGKANSTRANDIGRLERHIRPLLGTRIVEDLTKEDIRKAFAGIRDGKTATDVKTRSRGRSIVKGGEGAARMAIRVLRAIFSWGIEQGLLTDNPAMGIKLGKDGVRSAVIGSQEEYGNLFRALDQLEARALIRTQVAECIRVLALTGARKNEIAGMRWSWVDLKRGILTVPANSHKTGKDTGDKEIALPSLAQEIITRQPGSNSDDYVFPPSRGDNPMSLSKPWQLIHKEAKLPEGLGIHGLRHSLATMMAIQGAGAPQIMSALGHKQLSTSARYIKNVDDARKDLMEKHTSGIAAALTESKPGKVVKIK